MNCWPHRFAKLIAPGAAIMISSWPRVSRYRICCEQITIGCSAFCAKSNRRRHNYVRKPSARNRPAFRLSMCRCSVWLDVLKIEPNCTYHYDYQNSGNSRPKGPVSDSQKLILNQVADKHRPGSAEQIRC